jgi:hypothetical protein
MSEFEIVLPTEKSPPELINPTTLVIFGLPKSGKTEALSKLDDNFLIDVEKGSGFAEAMRISVDKNWDPMKKSRWLRAVAKKIRDAGKPYKYVSIDTFSEVDEWSEWTGTERYMSSSQGKKWNRYKKDDHDVDPKLIGTRIPFDSDDYESIHTMGEGYGYRWSRGESLDMYNELADLGSVCTIFVCHVADKSVVSKIKNTEVITRDISLTGKVRDILARKVDAIGYLYHEDGQTMISFSGNEEKIGGIRAKHIRGYEGPLDWNRIFI